MLNLQKFNCIIGLNGSGKTTLLQAFDFLSQLMLGNMKDWLKNRGWKNTELCNALSQKRLITFIITTKNNIEWRGEYNTQRHYCSSETIFENGKTLLKVHEGQYSLENDKREKIMFEYQGSIMSQLKTDGKLLELKNDINGLKSMELLSPHLMHGSSKGQVEDIGIYGERIHQFLFRLNKNEQENLKKEIVKFYPDISNWGVKAIGFGFKKLFIKENNITTDATHINDGLLRIIAILAQSLGKHKILLYDEIENGINPELIEKLVDYLVNSEKQIFVTTHSPLVLNYLEDDVAEKSVYLLYKTKEGYTKSELYFKYPEAKRKLEFFGPGEVYIDTSISDAVKYFIEEAK